LQAIRSRDIATLNGLGVAIFLVDAGGRIVHANAAGHDMVDEGDFLRSADGRLVARNVKVNQSLHEIFAGNALRGRASRAQRCRCSRMTASVTSRMCCR